MDPGEGRREGYREYRKEGLAHPIIMI